MAWRFVPLLVLVVAGAVVRWRVARQRRRYGGRAVRLRGAAERWKAAGGLALLSVPTFAALQAAAGAATPAGQPWMRAAGAALGGAGILLMIVAQLQLGASWRIGIDPDTRPGLVTHGLFAFVRNPIFLGMFLILAGLALLLDRTWVWAACAGLVLGIRLQVAAEEAWLREAYGTVWRAYASRVGRFTPWTGRLRPS